MTDPVRISPQEASAKLAEGWTYVDVRTVQEFEDGHPPGAVNVPLMHAGPGGMVPNPDFLAVMRAVFPVEAHTTPGAPSASARETATVMPRSLNEPVGFRPSSLKCSDARPNDGPMVSDSTHGVLPSPSVMCGAAGASANASAAIVRPARTCTCQRISRRAARPVGTDPRRSNRYPGA